MDEVFFAQIREDPRIEVGIATRRAAKRIVCVGSGGCVALSLLSDRVESVTAVDLNPAQCALIELKRAALVAFDRDGYLAFIGERSADDRGATFRRLAPRLPPEVRAFWEDRPEAISLGINHCGTTERFYRYVGSALRSVVPDPVWRELFACASVAEQCELHSRYFTDEAWRTAVQILLSKSTHLLFFPAFMFAHATEHDFGRFFAGQFDHEVRTKPIAANYFLSQFLFGRYLEGQPEGLPPYLARDRWDQTRRNAEKLTVVARPIQSFLATQRGVDAFFLSNVFDWMQPSERVELSRAALGAASPGASVLFRNMLSASESPPDLARRMAIDPAESASLHQMERSMSYQRVTCGVLS